MKRNERKNGARTVIETGKRVTGTESIRENRKRKSKSIAREIKGEKITSHKNTKERIRNLRRMKVIKQGKYSSGK